LPGMSLRMNVFLITGASTNLLTHVSFWREGVFFPGSLYSDWLRVGRLRVRSSSPRRGRFFPFEVVQIGSWAHSASYPVGTEGPFPGVKRLGRDADPSPPTMPGSRIHGCVHPSPLLLQVRYFAIICTSFLLWRTDGPRTDPKISNHPLSTGPDCFFSA
jgi:hypothetical protein